MLSGLLIGVYSMKEYIKKHLWLPVLCMWALLSLLSVLLLPSPARWICLSVIFFVATVLLLCIWLNAHCVALFKKLAPTSYFSDLRFRNMDAIAVGSTAAWHYLDIDAEKCYNAVGFRRSNAMCFNMLKTYFSHVCDGGTVFYIVDPAESDSIGDYISPCDFLHIHRLLFLYLGVSSPAKSRAYPLAFDFAFSIRCAAACFARKHGLCPASWKRSATSTLSLSDSMCEQLEEVLLFCEERELNCRFVFINRSDRPDEQSADEIRRALDRGRNLSISVVSDRSQLNSAICC